jgi:hypothetical protein
MASEPGTPSQVQFSTIVGPEAQPQDEPVPLESSEVPLSWLRKTLLTFGSYSISAIGASIG